MNSRKDSLNTFATWALNTGKGLGKQADCLVNLRQVQCQNAAWSRCVVVGVLAVSVVFLSGCGLNFKKLTPQAIPAHTATAGVQPNPQEAEEAQRIYQDAWRTVYEEYVDPTFNGQDWYAWKDRYKGKLVDREDAYVAIKTMLASLGDHYTRFLTPREMDEESLNIDSKLYGVGIQISVKNNHLVVVSPLEDTPAQKAGIRPQDVITHIDGEPTAGMSVENAADRIRGEAGTIVKLTVLREEENNRVFTVSVPRAEIKIKSVFTKNIQPKDIGYIRLNSFISENAGREMKKALESMKNKKAVILDIRGNYGGLLNNAVEIADLFLERGKVIVSTQDRKQSVNKEVDRHKQEFGKPLVLLIDGGSASASEILSGALKDHHRATLIGTTTFGKGLVQKISLLHDGSGIHITIAKYFTPEGTDINQKGIGPDIEVRFTEEDLKKDRDPQLERAIQFLKKKYRLAA